MQNISKSHQQPAHSQGIERRASTDRRRFSVRSIYCCLVSPRRTQGRRQEDRRYPLLDVFDGGAMACVVLLISFSILDAIFTLTLVSRGGTELNPLMNYFLSAGTAAFMAAKMALTTLPAIVLIASGNLMLFNTIRARSALGALIGLYAGLLVYEMGLLWTTA